MDTFFRSLTERHTHFLRVRVYVHVLRTCVHLHMSSSHVCVCVWIFTLEYACVCFSI